MLRLKLHAKFLTLILGSLAVFLSIVTAVVVHRESSLLAQKALERQRVLALALSGSLKENMRQGAPKSTRALINSLRGTSGLVRLDVLRRDGSPAFGGPRSSYDIPQIEKVFSTGEEVDFREQGPRPLHTMLVPLRNDLECRKCHGGKPPLLGAILISLSLEDIQRETGASARSLTVLLSALILIEGAILSVAVRKIVLRPLKTLHHGAATIGAGTLSHRIGLKTHDEFEDLARAFNEMAGKLEEARRGFENKFKKRTAQLYKNVSLTRGILASMSSGVALLDMDGRVKLMNRQGAQILRCRDDAVIGTRLADLLPETSPFMDADTGAYREIEIQTADGAIVPIGFSSTYYLGEQGEHEGVIIAYRDLSELKTLQSELLSKERFAAMGKLVAGVAHEIRNPLFGISSIAQLFERDLKTPVHRELVGALLSETKRLNRLVEELLIYGRPMKLRLERCDLRRLWEDVFTMHREELERRRIAITGDYEVRHPVAYLDAHQIRQVFLNLLRNALDATADGGSITIRLLIEDRYIIFKVADSGAGIPSENLDRVFDLFFTTKSRGTGLGLAICKKIVQDHGGEITIASEEGRGTTVTVKLPYRARPEEANGEARKSHNPNSREIPGDDIQN
jgi:signal transduction histidine kinase/HAMP domain-containing protein